MEAILAATTAVLDPKTLVGLSAGVAAGIIGGAIPGVTITMTIILVLPFTFGMDALQGIATMVGVYVGGSAGGLISACLLGIPGTPSAIATTFDGFPMARKGEPGRAVWLGIWASVFGGLIAGLFLVVGATQLALLALQFGPWEFFSLFILTLSIVSSLSEESLLKGLLASVVGLLVTTVGSDPVMGVPRFTFGTDLLRSGFPFLPVLVGVYAFSQIMLDLEQAREQAGLETRQRFNLKVSHLAVIREILRQPVNLIRSSLLGLWIGILPAVGGSAANILAYDQAKKMSRTPDRFGTGHSEGIVASESSNNANVGGSLITMMAFGIPGDAVTAVMLGALIIHGIQPGPLFVTTHTQIAYGLFAAYFIAHPLMVLIEGFSLRYILKIVNVPQYCLMPVILVLCGLGAFALNNLLADVWTLFFFGIVGYLMVKTGFPLAPLILGVILGEQIEQNLIRAIMTDSNVALFFTRPISGLFLLLSLASCGIGIYQARRHKRRMAAAGPRPADSAEL
ncbi:MAG: tripartite tricarboxylate transporter permease [candidate division NC10 bacterium]|nr:tripartite tricarboxylate transporter permease [candidate division NC10 bacterium]